MIVPVSSRSGSNYGFVAAHWPPRRYQANRVLLSHANSLATAVIALGRGLTSNTSWLVFSRTVGVSPLSLIPPCIRRRFSLSSLVIGRLVGGSSFYIFSPPFLFVTAVSGITFSFSVSTYGRSLQRVPRVCARASMSERYPHPVGLSCLPLSAHTPVATENQLVMLASFSARRKTAIC